MAAKQLIYDVKAREALLKGVNTLADAVKVTFTASARVFTPFSNASRAFTS